VGLVEEDWLQTIVNLPSVEFLDFVLEGRRLATELRSQGAQLVVALTHMRMPNAEKYDHLGHQHTLRVRAWDRICESLTLGARRTTWHLSQARARG
jgi:2',3'-cyclic-nucleotide 2'-phosphodiesterase (5'-nucleotidase family)